MGDRLALLLLKIGCIFLLKSEKEGVLVLKNHQKLNISNTALITICSWSTLKRLQIDYLTSSNLLLQLQLWLTCCKCFCEVLVKNTRNQHFNNILPYLV